MTKNGEMRGILALLFPKKSWDKTSPVFLIFLIALAVFLMGVFIRVFWPLAIIGGFVVFIYVVFFLISRAE